jgi:hypothetical protein
MILPTKRIPEDRALLAIGADVLKLLDRPQTVSKVWEELKITRANRLANNPLTFDWFTLSLAMLFAVQALVLENGRLRRATR